MIRSQSVTKYREVADNYYWAVVEEFKHTALKEREEKSEHIEEF